MKKILLSAALAATLAGHAASTDTTAINVGLREVSVTALKQTAPVSTPSTTVVAAPQLRRLGIEAPKGLSEIAPNLYAPDYGSRMTSSIYVRGMGTRIDQPVVGLNVDNVPVLNKDAFDTDLPDIERMEMARGPQSTLFGRNTMGGLITVRTLSPMQWQGVKITSSLGSHGLDRTSIGWYGLLTPELGMGASLLYNHSDGYRRNSYDGSQCGREDLATLRWKTVWAPSHRVSVENTASVSRTVQHGYPYAPAETGKIAYNDPMFYRRTYLTDGLTVKHVFRNVTFSSITSVQYLDDNMTIDQDFLPDPYFTITQSRRETALTEDIILTGRRGNYSWLAGAFGFWRHTSMHAPVNMKQAAIDRLILGKVNPLLPPGMVLAWNSDQFLLDSRFTMPDWGTAVYHQSSLELGKVTLTAGIRLDLEHTGIDYRSTCSTSATMNRMLPSGQLMPLATKEIDLKEGRKLGHNYLEALPKLSAAWSATPALTLSASAARGYKAGGYNSQMLSDMLQQALMKEVELPVAYDPREVLSYRPESSWNFELGAEYSLPSHRFNARADLFWIECHDQQLTSFPDSTTTGRIMTNAGRTRSRGIELQVQWSPFSQLELTASYGHTDARFRHYSDATGNYRGKRIPYAPANTLFASAAWTIACDEGSITLGAHCRAAGPIMWDDANTISQPFYATLGASVTFTRRNWLMRFWGENLTDTQYSTFHFVSIGNAFLQKGAPIRGGVTLQYSFATRRK